jgi:hypothetical protein
MPAKRELSGPGEPCQEIAHVRQPFLGHEGLPRAAACSDERLGTAEDRRKTLLEVLDEYVADVMAESVI